MSKQIASIDAIKKAIDIVGGNTQLSLKANISYQSIIDWKSGRKAPTPLNCIKIEKATDGKINRREILPEFPWDEFNQ
jgi:DNA-binding transcriptional regulator YdaS (Cro superfamily)